MPYKALLEGLPVQLAGGSGPDFATVTDLGGLNRYYLDLTPYVDAKYWQDNFGDVLKWYRSGPDDKGIYGMQTQLTITGAFINRTLFDQAKVAVPGKDATFDDWAKAANEVAKATGSPYPMAIDRPVTVSPVRLFPTVRNFSTPTASLSRSTRASPLS